MAQRVKQQVEVLLNPGPILQLLNETYFLDPEGIGWSAPRARTTETPESALQGCVQTPALGRADQLRGLQISTQLPSCARLAQLGRIWRGCNAWQLAARRLAEATTAFSSNIVTSKWRYIAHASCLHFLGKSYPVLHA